MSPINSPVNFRTFTLYGYLDQENTWVALDALERKDVKYTFGGETLHELYTCSPRLSTHVGFIDGLEAIVEYLRRFPDKNR